MYGPSEPTGIGPLLGILGLSTPDPSPKHLCLLDECRWCSCARTLYNALPMAIWPWYRSTCPPIRCISTTRSSIDPSYLFSRCFRSDVLMHIATILGPPLLRVFGPFARSSVMIAMQASYQRSPNWVPYLGTYSGARGTGLSPAQLRSTLCRSCGGMPAAALLRTPSTPCTRHTQYPRVVCLGSASPI